MVSTLSRPSDGWLEFLLCPILPVRKKDLVEASFCLRNVRSTGMDAAIMEAAISTPVQMFWSGASSASC